MRLSSTVGLLTVLLLVSGGAEAAGPPPAAAPTGCTMSTTPDLEIEGFGAGTLGGWQAGSDVYCVTSLADDGPGTLRDACRTGGRPRVVSFAVDGEIPLQTPISLPSNITLDGRGRDVAVVGKGFLLHGVEQVIITHLAIQDVFPEGEDGIQIGIPNATPSRQVVIDHVTFRQSGDGGSAAHVDEAISVIFGSHDITVAWCRFENWEKGLLLGNGDADASIDGTISVTVHHNFFDATGRRHPRGRYGRFDVYNNYLYDWHMYDKVGPPIWHESYGIFCEDQCRMVVEQNIFERYWHADDKLSEANQATKCASGGAINDLGRWVVPTSIPLRFDVHCQPGDFTRPYPARVDPADEALRQRLMRETGHRPGA